MSGITTVETARGQDSATRCSEPTSEGIAPGAEPTLHVSPDGRAFKKEGALKEYDARVQGIVATEAGIHQFTGFIMAAIAGITAAGINAKEDPYLFLVPIGLLIVANLYTTEKRWVIWLHAA